MSRIVKALWDRGQDELVIKRIWGWAAGVILVMMTILGPYAVFYQRGVDAQQDASTARALSEQTARLQLERTYNECIARVQTRDDLRQVLIDIVGLFERTEATGQVLNLIETRYPALPESDCGTPPLSPMTG